MRQAERAAQHVAVGSASTMYVVTSSLQSLVLAGADSKSDIAALASHGTEIGKSTSSRQ